MSRASTRAPSGLVTLRRLAAASVASYALLVLTGGAVRLTGSGLGCPDWPTCYHHQATAALSFHPMVEFGNRLVTVAVTVVSLATLLAALRVRPRRRDLVVPAALLVVGVLGQALLGGLVVLSHLDPYLVALHFLLTLAILVDALVLHHRARRPPGRTTALVGRELVWLARLLLGGLALVSVAGTMVTGAGPHAGAPGTPRVPVAFRDVAELHATLAMFLVGLTLAALFAFRQGRAPAGALRHGRLLLEAMAVQGALGYSQYFLHDAAGIVELHLAGVTTLWIVATGFYLSLFAPPRPALDGEATSTSVPAAALATASSAAAGSALLGRST